MLYYGLYVIILATFIIILLFMNNPCYTKNRESKNEKILLTILSLFLLTGCFSFEKSNSRPAITIDTDYLSGDASYLYYYQSLSSKEKEIYENIYNCILDNAKKVTISSNDYELVQKK